MAHEIQLAHPLWIVHQLLNAEGIPYGLTQVTMIERYANLKITDQDLRDSSNFKTNATRSTGIVLLKILFLARAVSVAMYYYIDTHNLESASNFMDLGVMHDPKYISVPSNMVDRPQVNLLRIYCLARLLSELALTFCKTLLSIVRHTGLLFRVPVKNRH
uniref:Uncharacterized protein n=1 Tax=Glossina austeni TaxID=7395 RepID=A0A1A9V2F6_GLOAU